MWPQTSETSDHVSRSLAMAVAAMVCLFANTCGRKSTDDTGQTSPPSNDVAIAEEAVLELSGQQLYRHIVLRCPAGWQRPLPVAHSTAPVGHDTSAYSFSFDVSGTGIDHSQSPMNISSHV